jgi:hypothetical protein
MLRTTAALVLLAPAIGGGAQSPNARAYITAAYGRADAANVAARTLDDVERIREWLDTSDCVYADFGQPPRTWSAMRAYAAEGLQTRLVAFHTTIQRFAMANDAILVTAIAKGVARVVDRQGRWGAPGGAHDVETTATVQDNWVKTDHWRRMSHTKIVANHLTAIDGKPFTEHLPAGNQHQ